MRSRPARSCRSNGCPNQTHDDICDQCRERQRSNPRVTIVCGPPASGKTTLVRDNIQPGDLAYDFDSIAFALTGPHDFEPHRDTVRPFVVAAREAILRLWRSKRPTGGKLWVILSGASIDQRTRLAAELRAEVVVLDVPAEECKRRIEADGGSYSADRVDAVDRWWSSYEPEQGRRTA